VRFVDLELTSDGRVENLDNIFRGASFSPSLPPADIRAAVDRVLGGPA
jgi:hypothetical protein